MGRLQVQSLKARFYGLGVCLRGCFVFVSLRTNTCTHTAYMQIHMSIPWAKERDCLQLCETAAAPTLVLAMVASVQAMLPLARRPKGLHGAQ